MHGYTAKHRKKRLVSDINVVPYIDVMLVLLVIFMVTAPLLTEGVKVDLVEAKAKQMKPKDEPFVVVVDKDGRYFINEELNAPSTENEIRVKAQAVLRNAPATPFLVRGDKNTKYEAVINAMVMLQQAGVESVGMVTDPPKQ